MDIRPEWTDELDVKVLLEVLTAVKKGDFSARMPAHWSGPAGKIADTLNDIIETNDKLAGEVEEVARAVGREGRLNQRASSAGTGGGWSDIVKSVNTLIDDLVHPTTELARVVSGVAKGDLSQRVGTEVDGRPLMGQFLTAATAANTMVDQLSAFTSEAARLAHEVGNEGRLGGAAHVPG
ncbi:MAG TPA: hybrid sensor histidine kinase/response regulator, partial [Noviherbaspirillum sp.]|nr:hybrid sensor histidine kinase/response regulator [Noviherbaspirillum sp.]